MSLQKNVCTVLELAEVATPEVDIPDELKNALAFCIGKRWVWTTGEMDLGCPETILLKDKGRGILAEDREPSLSSGRKKWEKRWNELNRKLDATLDVVKELNQDRFCQQQDRSEGLSPQKHLERDDLR